VNSAVFLLLQIVVSMVLSFFLIGEKPDLFLLLGAFLIMVSIYLVSRRPAPHEPPV
jgi:drug/metabolite transporter (DMT)-like permease